MIRRSVFDWLAAAHTPFTASGELALDVIEVQAEHLVGEGVNGVFICGTTGEGLSMSVPERKLVAQRWTEVRAETALSLWIHVGALALPDACELARHAAEVGADAIGVLPPFFFGTDGEEPLVAWCRAISEASGGLPMTLYECPSMTGVRLDLERFIALARESVPGYRGIKFTDANVELFGELCEGREEGEGMWWGRDEELCDGLLAGATGAIGSTYNFAARIYAPVLDLLAGGDRELAAAAQARSARLVEVIARHGYLGAAKAVMEMLGVSCGPARAPLRSPDAVAVARLRAELEELGFFEWIAR
jgi:N-acetylneuraminate lyase